MDNTHPTPTVEHSENKEAGCSPLPWRIGQTYEDGKYHCWRCNIYAHDEKMVHEVTSFESKETCETNAAHIVNCVNTHQSLLDEVSRLKTQIVTLKDELAICQNECAMEENIELTQTKQQLAELTKERDEMKGKCDWVEREFKSLEYVLSNAGQSYPHAAVYSTAQALLTELRAILQKGKV